MFSKPYLAILQRTRIVKKFWKIPLGDLSQVCSLLENSLQTTMLFPSHLAMALANLLLLVIAEPLKSL